MVHQPSGGFSGQASDIERHAEDIIKMKRRLNEIYVKHTSKPYEVIEKTLDRDYFMTADQAKEFGIIDGCSAAARRSKHGLHWQDRLRLLDRYKSLNLCGAAAIEGRRVIPWSGVCRGPY